MHKFVFFFQIEDGILDLIEVLDDSASMPEAIIPIEKADADFLFLVGTADRNWKSERHADNAVNRLLKAGRRNFEVSLSY